MTTNWSQLFADEWEYVCKLGSSIHDPEEKREFWENLKARKLADPSFRVEDLFPRDPAALEPPPASEDTAKRACREILEMLDRAGHGRKNVLAFEQKRTPVQEDAALIVELGGHYHPLCLWPRRKEYA